MSKHEVFIQGETLDLCIPNENAITEDGWYKWFNDRKITKYLAQGDFPNTIEDQLEFLECARKSKNRLLLLIRPKGIETVVGVVSLSNLDYRNKSAHLALVIGDRNFNAPHKELIGMEAKCRMLEHAFEVLGMERIFGGQVTELRLWQKWQILFGYRIEGIQRKAFRKGYKKFDVFITSVLLEDYLEIKKLRCDNFWPGSKEMMKLIKDLPKISYDRIIERALNRSWENYYKKIRMA